MRMNSCKKRFPKGNIWDLNHREERKQLGNAYNTPGTLSPEESELPCALPALHREHSGPQRGSGTCLGQTAGKWQP